MSKPTIIEFAAFAYLPKYRSLEDVVNGSEMPMIDVSPVSTYCAGQGYPMIGKVRLLIELDPQDTILANQVAALQAQLQSVRAENQNRENAILDQISKLTALTYESK